MERLTILTREDSVKVSWVNYDFRPASLTIWENGKVSFPQKTPYHPTVEQFGLWLAEVNQAYQFALQEWQKLFDTLPE